MQLQLITVRKIDSELLLVWRLCLYKMLSTLHKFPASAGWLFNKTLQMDSTSGVTGGPLHWFIVKVEVGYRLLQVFTDINASKTMYWVF